MGIETHDDSTARALVRNSHALVARDSTFRQYFGVGKSGKLEIITTVSPLKLFREHTLFYGLSLLIARARPKQPVVDCSLECLEQMYVLRLGVD